LGYGFGLKDTIKGMCEVCNHTELVANVRQYDPTRTVTLRNAFVSSMDRKFRHVATQIKKAIVDQDCFGLIDAPTVSTNLPNFRQFQFLTDDRKIAAFMEWLKKQIDSGILQVGFGRQLGEAIRSEWTDAFVADSYRRGVIRARYELRGAGYDVPSLETTGGIAASMSTPFHLDRVGVLFLRVFNDLKGITDAMDSQISRVLAQGMIDGDHPRLIARKLMQVMDGKGKDLGLKDTLGRWIPAKRRAQMLARTEMIRAHHLATIQEYRNWGVVGVNVQAEWRTAGDDRVCPVCAPLHGRIFTLDEIEPIIPMHLNCRCLALPALITKK